MNKPQPYAAVFMYGNGDITVEFDGVEKLISEKELAYLRSVGTLQERREAGYKLWLSKPPIRLSEDGGTVAKCGMPPHRGSV